MSMMFETMVETRSALARRRFRAGGAYDLVALDRLPPEEQPAVSELRGDPQMYGLFKPRDGGVGRTVKAVSKDVALLWFTLQTPGPLPALLLGAEPDAALESAAQLLLDDIIEIEDRGEFVSGARAAALLERTDARRGRARRRENSTSAAEGRAGDGTDAGVRSEDGDDDARGEARGRRGDGVEHEDGDGVSRLVRLSHDALRYGEALQLTDPQALATRLYCFGREPVSAENERRFAADEDLLSFLGAGVAGGSGGASGAKGGKGANGVNGANGANDASSANGLSRARGASANAVARRLAQTWRRVDKAELAGWIAWTRTDDRGRRVKAGRPTFKLYVSPRLDVMPAAFAETVDVLSDSEGAHFKVGRHAGGLLRPDKLVAYFAELDDLLAAATRLGERLRGVTPHGVPFSAEIALDGLLSWGMDPPAEDRAVSWQPAESWRLWVARRLAAAMVAAQRDPSPDLPPWRFALARVRCDGVDVERWTPSTSMWTGA